jgi:hypothetical protein
MFSFIKKILFSLGVLGGLATVTVIVIAIIQPNISIVIGSNNNVNQKIQTSPVTTPLPAQTKPSGEASPNNNPEKDEAVTESNDSSKIESKVVPYQENQVIKTRGASTYRPASRANNDYNVDTSDEDEDEDEDVSYSERNSYTCPTRLINNRVNISEEYENSREIRRNPSQETESYRETQTTINGVTTTTRTSSRTVIRVTRTSTNGVIVDYY